MFSTRLRYNHEFAEKLRVGFVGCGGQAFRNILPSFQYAPIDLVAVADLDVERASAYARRFGAERSYQDYRSMLDKERLDAVFFATGYDRSGRPLYPAQAADALQAGCHAWIEKPPAASRREIEKLSIVSAKSGRKVAVGFMKMFTPGITKIRSILKSGEFGSPTSLYLRDPEQLPERARRHDLTAMTWVLDHVVHSASVIQTLMGPVRRIYIEEGPDGEAMVSMKFRNGAAGVLHMAWGQSGTCPKERLEIIGQGANVIFENNICLTYYRPGHYGSGPFEYGRIGDYLTDNSQAPLAWRMDGYSGQPYNMHVFYQGYAHQILYFCERVMRNESIMIGGLSDAWHVTQYFEALQSFQDEPVEFELPPPGLQEESCS